MPKGGGVAARGEGSVDIGGREGGGGGGGGGRVSSSTEPIQTRNLSYQFLLGGVAKSSPVRLGVRYINAVQKFCRPRRGRARVSTASRGSHRHHRRPTTTTSSHNHLSLSLDRDFRRLLVRVYPDYVAEYTSGRVFASFLSSRRVSFRPVNCACPSPLSPLARARGVISPRGRCVEEDRSMMDRLIRFVFFSRFSKIHCFSFRFSEFCYILRTMKYNMRCYL